MFNWQNNVTPLNDTNLNGAQTQLMADILLACHPVGSYYWSTESTDPGTLFGGTWSQVKDKFVLAIGDTYTTITTGGNASHNLDISGIYAKANPTGGGVNYQNAGKSFTTNYSITGNSGTKGASSQSNSNAGIDIGGTLSSGDNLPPYETAYCWKRTA